MQKATPTKSAFGAATPEEATWTCETCGEIPPRYIQGLNRYMRGQCSCQLRRIEEYRAEDERKRNDLAERGRINFTYNWLNSNRWSDEPLAEKTFANFDVLRQPGAYESVLAFADVMTGTLILYGSYGTGKTHLLTALCQEMRKRGTDSRFATAPKMFGAIQQAISEDSSYSSIIHRAIAAQLLIIDDIDKAKWSEFREEIYFEIIDSRVNAKKPIAISTNRLDALSSFIGGACASRLSIGQIAVEMIGDEYRQEM